MNILIIGTTDILGGAAGVSWSIKEAMEKGDHTVSMFVADKRSNDANVKIIPRSTWRKYLCFLLNTEGLIDTDWILQTEEFKKADIVHCHNLHGRFFNLETLQKMTEIKPVVWTLHDEWALTPHCAYTLEGKNISNGLYVCPSKNIAPRILWNNTIHLTKWKNNIYSKLKNITIVTPSNWLLNRVKNTSLSSSKTLLIPNGIDTNLFKQHNKAESRKKLRLPLDKKIILFLATDAKNNTWKGWKYTEEAIRSYSDKKDVLFLNVGNLSKHTDTDQVQYVGHIYDKEVLSQYYSAADALLFTSIAENFPLVILEAMNCGLPIVAFDVGGVKEVLTHKENGYIAEYINTKELINGLNWVLSQPQDTIEAISSSSIKKIENQYTKEIMIKSYIDLYRELHGNNK